MSATLGVETADPTDFESLRAALKRAAVAVERTLDDVLPKPEGLHARIPEAMRYAIFAGGKRLRPFLTLASAGLFAVPPDARAAGRRGDRGAAHLFAGA